MTEIGKINGFVDYNPINGKNEDDTLTEILARAKLKEFSKDLPKMLKGTLDYPRQLALLEKIAENYDSELQWLVQEILWKNTGKKVPKEQLHQELNNLIDNLKNNPPLKHQAILPTGRTKSTITFDPQAPQEDQDPVFEKYPLLSIKWFFYAKSWAVSEELKKDACFNAVTKVFLKTLYDLNEKIDEDNNEKKFFLFLTEAEKELLENIVNNEQLPNDIILTEALVGSEAYRTLESMLQRFYDAEILTTTNKNNFLAPEKYYWFHLQNSSEPDQEKTTIHLDIDKAIIEKLAEDSNFVEQTVLSAYDGLWNKVVAELDQVLGEDWQKQYGYTEKKSIIKLITEVLLGKNKEGKDNFDLLFKSKGSQYLITPEDSYTVMFFKLMLREYLEKQPELSDLERIKIGIYFMFENAVDKGTSPIKFPEYKQLLKKSEVSRAEIFQVLSYLAIHPDFLKYSFDEKTSILTIDNTLLNRYMTIKVDSQEGKDIYENFIKKNGEKYEEKFKNYVKEKLNSINEKFQNLTNLVNTLEEVKEYVKGLRYGTPIKKVYTKSEIEEILKGIKSLIEDPEVFTGANQSLMQQKLAEVTRILITEDLIEKVKQNSQKIPQVFEDNIITILNKNEHIYNLAINKIYNNVIKDYEHKVIVQFMHFLENKKNSTKEDYPLDKVIKSFNKIMGKESLNPENIFNKFDEMVVELIDESSDLFLPLMDEKNSLSRIVQSYNNLNLSYALIVETISQNSDSELESNLAELFAPILEFPQGIFCPDLLKKYFSHEGKLVIYSEDKFADIMFNVDKENIYLTEEDKKFLTWYKNYIYKDSANLFDNNYSSEKFTKTLGYVIRNSILRKHQIYQKKDIDDLDNYIKIFGGTEESLKITLEKDGIKIINPTGDKITFEKTLAFDWEPTDIFVTFATLFTDPNAQLVADDKIEKFLFYCKKYIALINTLRDENSSQQEKDSIKRKYFSSSNFENIIKGSLKVFNPLNPLLSIPGQLAKISDDKGFMPTEIIQMLISELFSLYFVYAIWRGIVNKAVDFTKYKILGRDGGEKYSFSLPDGTVLDFDPRQYSFKQLRRLVKDYVDQAFVSGDVEVLRTMLGKTNTLFSDLANLRGNNSKPAQQLFDEALKNLNQILHDELGKNKIPKGIGVAAVQDKSKSDEPVFGLKYYWQKMERWLNPSRGKEIGVAFSYLKNFSPEFAEFEPRIRIDDDGKLLVSLPKIEKIYQDLVNAFPEKKPEIESIYQEVLKKYVDKNLEEDTTEVMKNLTKQTEDFVDKLSEIVPEAKIIVEQYSFAYQNFVEKVLDNLVAEGKLIQNNNLYYPADCKDFSPVNSLREISYLDGVETRLYTEKFSGAPNKLVLNISRKSFVDKNLKVDIAIDEQLKKDFPESKYSENDLSKIYTEKNIPVDEQNKINDLFFQARMQASFKPISSEKEITAKDPLAQAQQIGNDLKDQGIDPENIKGRSHSKNLISQNDPASGKLAAQIEQYLSKLPSDFDQQFLETLIKQDAQAIKLTKNGLEFVLAKKNYQIIFDDQKRNYQISVKDGESQKDYIVTEAEITKLTWEKYGEKASPDFSKNEDMSALKEILVLMDKINLKFSLTEGFLKTLKGSVIKIQNNSVNQKLEEIRSLTNDYFINDLFMADVQKMNELEARFIRMNGKEFSEALNTAVQDYRKTNSRENYLRLLAALRELHWRNAVDPKWENNTSFDNLNRFSALGKSVIGEDNLEKLLKLFVKKNTVTDKNIKDQFGEKVAKELFPENILKEYGTLNKGGVTAYTFDDLLGVLTRSKNIALNNLLAFRKDGNDAMFRLNKMQLMGVAILQNGGILGAKCGEGKTIIARMHGILQAIQGKTVVITTSSKFLAQSQAEEDQTLLQRFGVNVSSYNQNSGKISDSGIIYMDNNDMNFLLINDVTASLHGESPKLFTDDFEKKLVIVADEIDYAAVIKSKIPFMISRMSEKPDKDMPKFVKTATLTKDILLSIWANENSEQISKLLKGYNISEDLVDNIRQVIGDQHSTDIQTYLLDLPETRVLIEAIMEKEGMFNIQQRFQSEVTKEEFISHFQMQIMDCLQADNMKKGVNYAATDKNGNVVTGEAKAFIPQKAAKIVPKDESNDSLSKNSQYVPRVLMPYYGGLHGALCVKEGVKEIVNGLSGDGDSMLVGEIYKRLAGVYRALSGTPGAAYGVHNKMVVDLPKNAAPQMVKSEYVYKDSTSRDVAILKSISQHHKKSKNPLGIYVADPNKIAKWQEDILQETGVTALVFDSTKSFSEQEAIFEKAAKSGAIVIFTNAGGRGIDWKVDFVKKFNGFVDFLSKGNDKKRSISEAFADFCEKSKDPQDPELANLKEALEADKNLSVAEFLQRGDFQKYHRTFDLIVTDVPKDGWAALIQIINRTDRNSSGGNVEIYHNLADLSEKVGLQPSDFTLDDKGKVVDYFDEKIIKEYFVNNEELIEQIFDQSEKGYVFKDNFDEAKLAKLDSLLPETKQQLQKLFDQSTKGQILSLQKAILQAKTTEGEIAAVDNRSVDKFLSDQKIQYQQIWIDLGKAETFAAKMKEIQTANVEFLVDKYFAGEYSFADLQILLKDYLGLTDLQKITADLDQVTMKSKLKKMVEKDYQEKIGPLLANTSMKQLGRMLDLNAYNKATKEIIDTINNYCNFETDDPQLKEKIVKAQISEMHAVLQKLQLIFYKNVISQPTIQAVLKNQSIAGLSLPKNYRVEIKVSLEGFWEIQKQQKILAWIQKNISDSTKQEELFTKLKNKGLFDFNPFSIENQKASIIEIAQEYKLNDKELTNLFYPADRQIFNTKLYFGRGTRSLEHKYQIIDGKGNVVVTAGSAEGLKANWQKKQAKKTTGKKNDSSQDLFEKFPQFRFINDKVALDNLTQSLKDANNGELPAELPDKLALPIKDYDDAKVYLDYLLTAYYQEKNQTKDLPKELIGKISDSMVATLKARYGKNHQGLVEIPADMSKIFTLYFNYLPENPTEKQMEIHRLLNEDLKNFNKDQDSFKNIVKDPDFKLFETAGAFYLGFVLNLITTVGTDSWDKLKNSFLTADVQKAIAQKPVANLESLLQGSLEAGYNSAKYSIVDESALFLFYVAKASIYKFFGGDRTNYKALYDANPTGSSFGKYMFHQGAAVLFATGWLDGRNQSFEEFAQLNFSKEEIDQQAFDRIKNWLSAKEGVANLFYEAGSLVTATVGVKLPPILQRVVNVAFMRTVSWVLESPVRQLVINPEMEKLSVNKAYLTYLQLYLTNVPVLTKQQFIEEFDLKEGDNIDDTLAEFRELIFYEKSQNSSSGDYVFFYPEIFEDDFLNNLQLKKPELADKLKNLRENSGYIRSNLFETEKAGIVYKKILQAAATDPTCYYRFFRPLADQSLFYDDFRQSLQQGFFEYKGFKDVAEMVQSFNAYHNNKFGWGMVGSFTSAVTDIFLLTGGGLFTKKALANPYTAGFLAAVFATDFLGKAIGDIQNYFDPENILLQEFLYRGAVKKTEIGYDDKNPGIFSQIFQDFPDSDHPDAKNYLIYRAGIVEKNISDLEGLDEKIKAKILKAYRSVHLKQSDGFLISTINREQSTVEMDLAQKLLECGYFEKVLTDNGIQLSELDKIAILNAVRLGDRKFFEGGFFKGLFNNTLGSIATLFPLAKHSENLKSEQLNNFDKLLILSYKKFLEETSQQLEESKDDNTQNLKTKIDQALKAKNYFIDPYLAQILLSKQPVKKMEPLSLATVQAKLAPIKQAHLAGKHYEDFEQCLSVTQYAEGNVAITYTKPVHSLYTDKKTQLDLLREQQISVVIISDQDLRNLGVDLTTLSQTMKQRLKELLAYQVVASLDKTANAVYSSSFRNKIKEIYQNIDDRNDLEKLKDRLDSFDKETVNKLKQHGWQLEQKSKNSARGAWEEVFVEIKWSQEILKKDPRQFWQMMLELLDKKIITEKQAKILQQSYAKVREKSGLIVWQQPFKLAQEKIAVVTGQSVFNKIDYLEGYDGTKYFVENGQVFYQKNGIKKQSKVYEYNQLTGGVKLVADKSLKVVDKISDGKILASFDYVKMNITYKARLLKTLSDCGITDVYDVKLITDIYGNISQLKVITSKGEIYLQLPTDFKGLAKEISSWFGIGVPNITQALLKTANGCELFDFHDKEALESFTKRFSQLDPQILKTMKFVNRSQAERGLYVTINGKTEKLFEFPRGYVDKMGFDPKVADLLEQYAYAVLLESLSVALENNNLAQLEQKLVRSIGIKYETIYPLLSKIVGQNNFRQSSWLVRLWLLLGGPKKKQVDITTLDIKKQQDGKKQPKEDYGQDRLFEYEGQLIMNTKNLTVFNRLNFALADNGIFEDPQSLKTKKTLYVNSENKGDEKIYVIRKEDGNLGKGFLDYVTGTNSDPEILTIDRRYLKDLGLDLEKLDGQTIDLLLEWIANKLTGRIKEIIGGLDHFNYFIPQYRRIKEIEAELSKDFEKGQVLRQIDNLLFPKPTKNTVITNSLPKHHLDRLSGPTSIFAN